MAQDDTPGTETGQTPSGDVQPQTPAASPPPPAESGGRTYTQQELDAVAAKARRDADNKAKAAEARIAELEAAEAERARAEMTELERARAEAEEAKAAMAAAKSEAAASALAADRANILAAEAPTLPNAYKQMVTGADPDAIRASLQAAQEAYEADRRRVLADVATMTPEQIAAMGDELKPLAERLAGQPVSIGAPSSAGAPAPPPPASGSSGLQAVPQRGSVPDAVRKRSLVAAITGQTGK